MQNDIAGKKGIISILIRKKGNINGKKKKINKYEWDDNLEKRFV